MTTRSKAYRRVRVNSEGIVAWVFTTHRTAYQGPMFYLALIIVLITFMFVVVVISLGGDSSSVILPCIVLDLILIYKEEFERRDAIRSLCIGRDTVVVRYRRRDVEMEARVDRQNFVCKKKYFQLQRSAGEYLLLKAGEDTVRICQRHYMTTQDILALHADIQSVLNNGARQ